MLQHMESESDLLLHEKDNEIKMNDVQLTESRQQMKQVQVRTIKYISCGCIL